MKTIKLEKHELEELKKNSLQLINLQQLLGTLSFQKIIIEDEERIIAKEISEILRKEDIINESYVKKYGKGQIDLDKEEFNIIK